MNSAEKRTFGWLGTRSALVPAMLAASLLGACASAGMGKGVREDITARMTSAQAPLAACYDQALEEQRKLAGTMWVKFDVEPKTGKFTNVAVTQSEVQNPALETCVTTEVGKLVLAAPQKTVVNVDYPIHFAPEPQ